MSETKKTKRILLITPPPPPIGTSPMHYGDRRPPLGLGFLTAFAEQFGHTVRIVDNLIQEYDIKKEIHNFNPDFIGVYVNTTSFLMALKLIEEIKKCTEAPIICGGPHVTLLPETLEKYADYLVVGEGELALKQILDGQAKNKIIRKEFIKNLDVLPWPNYQHFIDKPYNWRLDLYKEDVEPIFSMNTSRGCPSRCQFCAVESIWGKAYRVFSGEKIVEEIENLVKKYGAKGIYFREDNFTAHRMRLIEFCKLLEERKINIVWTCETRADLERELVHRLAKIGCRGFYIGVESGSQRMLDLMNKNIKLEQIRYFFSWCKEAGIKTYATICYGTPPETEEDRKITEEFLLEIKPDAIDRFVYTGVPGSPYYDYLKKNKLYYHMDESGFIYTDTFRELVAKLYPESDSRVQFLRWQEETLRKQKA